MWRQGGPRPGRVHVGRWAGGQHLLPSTLSELREGGFGLVSCLPIWGRRVWIQPWTVLDYSARVIYGPDQQIDKISSLVKSVLSPLASQHLLSSRP